MNYEEKLQYYQTRYFLYHLSPPPRELVENDLFRCPCCGKIAEISQAHKEAKNGKTLHRNTKYHGGWIVVTKRIDRVLFYVCDKCKKDNDELDDDPILVWSICSLAIVSLIGDFAFCIYKGIHNGNFSFIMNCVVHPLLLGFILFIVLCLITMILRFLLSKFRHKNASVFDLSMITSMKTLAEGNALV